MPPRMLNRKSTIIIADSRKVLRSIAQVNSEEVSKSLKVQEVEDF